MSLDVDAKKTLLRKIPHGLFVCGVRNGDEVNGFTASWVTQGSFDPPLVVMGVRADSSSHAIIEATVWSEVWLARTFSSSFMTLAGEKKCRPTT